MHLIVPLSQGIHTINVIYDEQEFNSDNMIITTNQTLGSVFPTTSTMLFYAAGVYCHTP